MRLFVFDHQLSEERANASKRREDMAAANQRLEDLKLEQNTLQGSLGAERRNAQKLKVSGGELSKKCSVISVFYSLAYLTICILI